MSTGRFRTRTQLDVEFADNSQKKILPSDSRDLIASAFQFAGAGVPDPLDDVDNSRGIGWFQEGSRWLDTSSGNYYICRSAVHHNAVWELVYEHPWTPKEVAGLVCWLDARVGVFSDASMTVEVTPFGNVMAWQDQSGVGNHVTSANAVGTWWPQRLNCNPTILWGGTYGLVNTDFHSLDSKNKFTCFVVLSVPRPPSDTLCAVLAFPDLQTEPLRAYPRADGHVEWDTIVEGTTTFGVASVTYADEVDKQEVFTVQFDGDLNDPDKIVRWKNGILESIGESGTWPSDLLNSNILSIGVADGIHAPAFDGNLCQVLIFDKVLTDADREKVEDYLLAIAPGAVVNNVSAGSGIVVDGPQSCPVVSLNAPIDLSAVPSLPATKITSGTLDLSLFPVIPYTGIDFTGFDGSLVGCIDASQICSGSIDGSLVGCLDASQICSGVIDSARLPGGGGGGTSMTTIQIDWTDFSSSIPTPPIVIATLSDHVAITLYSVQCTSNIKDTNGTTLAFSIAYRAVGGGTFATITTTPGVPNAGPSFYSNLYQTPTAGINWEITATASTTMYPLASGHAIFNILTNTAA